MSAGSICQTHDAQTVTARGQIRPDGASSLAEAANHGRPERVQAGREHADRLLIEARRHLDSAEATCESDPEGAYGTLYDAGRKALWAILANQGLRPTTKGGHLGDSLGAERADACVRHLSNSG